MDSFGRWHPHAVHCSEFPFALQVYDDGSKLDRATLSKLPRDTLNRTALSKERRTGNVQSTMQRAHLHPGPVQKAAHGHRPIIETTFYRKSNAFLLA